YVMNFRREFRSKVMDYFAAEYREGRTPNPCIACNRYIKWEALLHRAREIGADYIATGHYGSIVRLPNGRYSVAKSADNGKDQSYVLYSLTQEELAHTLFVLGGYNKDEVRLIAARAGLPVAAKKDSQDICFVPDGDYAAFIERHTGEKSVCGSFVDSDGNILGQHRGIAHYTVGQRKGLGIAFGEPRFVLRINPRENTVVLGTKEELTASRVYVSDVNYMACGGLSGAVRVTGKLRYSQKEAPCTIRPQNDGILAEFDEPQRAATPGQAAVFYDNGCILCGGVIE
ncbi:MAG: tRNA 2-thiouridine(34) synthase MnmA, partial [Butyrivibrio sp.]|nr:tRNA 2-thiouridine(34) synthase MnmA [Butyrivibrio sp.]